MARWFWQAMELALFQPDIPQNAGTLLRLGACLGVRLHIIGPAGFDVSDRRLRRSHLDYLEHADLVRHTGWPAFKAWLAEPLRRLVLLTTSATMPYTAFAFRPDDIILLGRETVGVPDFVHETADARLVVPMRPGLRSINVALAGAMVVGEALRQTDGFPPVATKQGLSG